ncbi:N-acetylmuramoyl-L-alanine amidase [Fibrella sp. HMF5335]|uniref:N-acetylmuramoyl-L-alanine amidase n=1 Tax=Fibrella rubiginis TaxID=2817060 RepID=A0A939GIZ0_9BACT|nr:N-acetylmuramoyl-L-alanine amidase [Fibrella rubiginis]MBO0939181.1 N-acetylmuramoyl-L-alanine amidase [Fibrella rubiginis]
MKASLLVCIGWLLTVSVVAQVPKETETRSLTVQPNQPIQVAYEQPFSSAILLLQPGQSLTNSYLIAGADTLRLYPEPHPERGPSSALCVFRKPVSRLTLLTGELRGIVSLVSLYAPPLPAGYVDNAMRSAARQDCGKPPVVPAAIWRTGLAPPKEAPVATKVQFVIVHHSAGGNTVADYAEEVRNIYLLHTQNNGWNDVGYNFLVGQNGVVYEGRDGQGVIDGDNVLGAHFCSQNSGTMGICLMGNFNDVPPNAASLAVLEQWIGWKLKKEGIADLNARAIHASSGKLLGLVSGHRDGSCATECPGENLYAALPAVRQRVTQTCSFTMAVSPMPLATEPLAGATWTVYPNPSNGPVTVYHHAADPAQVHFTLLDALGRSVAITAHQSTADTWVLEPAGRLSGLYWLRARDKTDVVVKPVLIGQ